MTAGEPRRAIPIPRREFVVLKAYIEHGSHKAAAHALGIAESTGRQPMSALQRRLGARTAAEAAWLMRSDLERERPPTPITPRRASPVTQIETEEQVD